MILLRSSWQTVNIGDITHTPGALRLLVNHLRGVQIGLWPVSVGDGVREMLQAAFPSVRIVKGRVGSAGKPDSDELQRAFEETRLLVHGSGPSVVAYKDLAAWHATTAKPFGILGVTVGSVSEELKELLSAASFIFCRDTLSLDVLRKAGVACPVMEFAPDATFAFDMRDEARGTAYLQAHGLEDRGFICVIPRLRFTPYHKIRKTTNWTPEHIEEVERVNDETKERDHAKLREVIISWVRETGLKVLACPEMTYEVEVAKELLVDPLPAEVKEKVVWRDSYWLPDEAASVYARARALVSFEMHSPIIAAAVGTPAIHVRQPTDTSKGQMWRDIGLGEWLFEVDEAQGSDIFAALKGIYENDQAAQAKLASAMRFVHERFDRELKVVGAAGGL